MYSVIDSNIPRGKIITICGLDLTGKTTQAKLLAQNLGAVYLKFPSEDTAIGTIIRSILNNAPVSINVNNKKSAVEWLDRDPRTFQALNFADKINKQKLIEEILLSNTNIIMDRYDIDALVYGVVDGCGKNWTSELNKLLIPSDIAIYFDGPQYKRESEKDLYEDNEEFMNNIKSTFDSLFKTSSYNNTKLVTFNTRNEPKERVSDRLLGLVEHLLKNG